MRGQWSGFIITTNRMQTKCHPFLVYFVDFQSLEVVTFLLLLGCGLYLCLAPPMPELCPLHLHHCPPKAPFRVIIPTSLPFTIIARALALVELRPVFAPNRNLQINSLLTHCLCCSSQYRLSPGKPCSNLVAQRREEEKEEEKEVEEKEESAKHNLEQYSLCTVSLVANDGRFAVHFLAS